MDAGDVTVRAGELEIRNGGSINSTTFTEGDAGRVAITADHLIVRDGTISSDTFGEGDARRVVVTADDLTVRDVGFISSELWRR